MMLKKKLTFILTAFLLVSTLAACGSGNTESAGTTVRMGSKDFTESLVVSEIYALALEDAGYRVERSLNIAGSLVHQAITNNEIDIYPEYTGTGLLSILQMDVLTDPDEVYRVVKGEYESQFHLIWLKSSTANDGQGMVIRTDLAQELGITTISDLQAQAESIRFASQGEFDLREDGLPGLEKVYGPFDFKSSTVYDNGLKYQVLQDDEADVTPAYTTEGQLTNTDQFTLLVDDKQMWPPYYLAPVARAEILEANPSIADVLNAVSATLDTQTVTNLNAQIDVQQLEYEEVAQTYYDTIKASIQVVQLEERPS